MEQTDGAVTPAAPAGRGFTRDIVRGVVLPTAIVGLGVAVVTWITMGTKAGIGALLATALVIAFFMVGQLVLASVLQSNPMMAMPIALVLYIAKIGVLLLLIMLLSDTSWFDSKVFAATILACTLVWTIAEVLVVYRTKALVVEPDNVPPAVRAYSEYTEDKP